MGLLATRGYNVNTLSYSGLLVGNGATRGEWGYPWGMGLPVGNGAPVGVGLSVG